MSSVTSDPSAFPADDKMARGPWRAVSAYIRLQASTLMARTQVAESGS